MLSCEKIFFECCFGFSSRFFCREREKQRSTKIPILLFLSFRILLFLLIRFLFSTSISEYSLKRGSQERGYIINSLVPNRPIPVLSRLSLPDEEPEQLCNASTNTATAEPGSDSHCVYYSSKGGSFCSIYQYINIC